MHHVHICIHLVRITLRRYLPEKGKQGEIVRMRHMRRIRCIMACIKANKHGRNTNRQKLHIMHVLCMNVPPHKNDALPCHAMPINVVNQLIIVNMQPIFFKFPTSRHHSFNRLLYVPGYCIQRRLTQKCCWKGRGGHRLLFALTLVHALAR